MWHETLLDELKASTYTCRYKTELSVAVKILQNAFPTGAPSQTPLGELITLPWTHSRLGRANIPSHTHIARRIDWWGGSVPKYFYAEPPLLCRVTAVDKVFVCLLRYPLPQHYSVTMELAKDRTTKATVETCSSDSFDMNQCPQHVSVGQQFIHRSLNEPCHKMVNEFNSLYKHTRYCLLYTSPSPRD